MAEYDIQINRFNQVNVEYDQLYPQAMKHGATHLPDGDDPIGLTYSDVDAAPAGFGGFGEVMEYVTGNTDAELFAGLDVLLSRLQNRSSMRVAVTSSETLASWQYDGVLEKFGDTIAIYKGITYGANPSGSTNREPWEIVISKTDENWIIERVNPPMTLGVEYRTTERYLDKPVYIQARSIPAGPTVNSTIVVTFGVTVSGIVGFGGTMTLASGEVMSIPGVLGNGNPALEAGAFCNAPNSSSVQLWVRNVSEFDFTGSSGSCWIKYTKD